VTPPENGLLSEFQPNPARQTSNATQTTDDTQPKPESANIAPNTKRTPRASGDITRRGGVMGFGSPCGSGSGGGSFIVRKINARMMRQYVTDAYIQ